MVQKRIVFQLVGQGLSTDNNTRFKIVEVHNLEKLEQVVGTIVVPNKNQALMDCLWKEGFFDDVVDLDIIEISVKV